FGLLAGSSSPHGTHAGGEPLSMPLAVLFAYLGAAGAGALALWTAVRAGRSIPRWSFVAGMALLAIETGAAGACAQADSLVQAEEWQQVRLMAESALPAAWLLFSLTYARGARPLNWRRTMPVLAAAGLPVAWWLFRPGVLPLVDGTSTETAFRLP